MAIVRVNPIDATPSTTGAFVDVDMDNYIASLPANVSGVLLKIDNTSTTTSYALGLRPNGSTDNRTDSIRRDGLIEAIIGVDADNIFECYIGNTAVKVWIIGYALDSDFVAFTNGISKSVGSGAWTDVGIAADTGTDTAKASVCEWTANVAYGQRNNGSTDNRVIAPNSHGWWTSGVDASEIFEVYRTSGGNNPWLTGYFKAGVTMHVNAIDRSLADVSAWTDKTLSAGAGGIIEVTVSGASDVKYGTRKNGATDDITGYPGGELHGWSYPEADSSSIIEGWIDNTGIDFWELGTFDAASSGQTISIGVGTFSVSGFSPSIGIRVSIGSVNVSILGFSPSVSLNTPISISTGSISVSGTQSIIAKSISFNTGLLSFSGFSVSFNQSWKLEKGVTSFSGFSPSIVVSVYLPIEFGSFELTGSTLTFSSIVRLGVDSLNVSGLTTTFNYSLPIGVGLFVVDGFSPLLSQSVNLSIGSGSVQINGYALNQSQQIVLGGLSSVVISGFSPTPTVGAQTISIGVGVVTLSGLTPSIFLSALALGVGEVSINGFSESFGEKLSAIGSADVLSQGFAPSLNSKIPINIGSLNFTGYSLNLQTSVSNIQIGVGSTTFGGFSLLLITGYPTIDIGVGVFSFSGFSITVDQLLLIRSSVKRGETSLNSNRPDTTLISNRVDMSYNSKRSST